ncbi:MAG: CrcB family protein [Euryarchaeota archaeon]|nr:CrcB family protein [Euryarchaeota archaeon]MDE1837064.1 CrcB family protein [Euryarchaeota archaeon]MDE1880995.1 CrcB family protein [Euryarchaeota archaeon]MDE2046433.1 CrcB family protein [Thermoplasmata archaeon]
MDTQQQLRLVALVATGGAIGSVLRYGVSGALSRTDFPWGTFAVNFTGTFLLALLFFLSLERGLFSPELRALLFVGVFGGYTTFSTFGLETVTLLRGGETLLGAFNILLNGGICLGAAFLGAGVGLLLAGGQTWS